MKPILSEADVDELVRSARAYYLLAAWGSEGYLARLAAEPEPVPLEVLGGDPRALRQTAGILGHLGILVRHGLDGQEALWSLSPTAKVLLSSSRLPTRWIAATEVLQLPTILREGGPVRDSDGAPMMTAGGVREDDPEDARRFMAMLWRRSEHAASATASLLPLGGGRRALDLGGGHGRYAAELGLRGWAVTLLDKAMITAIAKERYGESLDYRTGDFLADGARAEDLGGPYELALLSNIVHGLTNDEFAGLLGRLRAAIAPGGRVVLKDMYLDDSGVGPEQAAFFDMTMLLYTPGRSYSTAEVRRALHMAGFQSVEVIYAADQEYSLIVGR